MGMWSVSPAVTRSFGGRDTGSGDTMTGLIGASSPRAAGHAFVQNLRRGFYDLGTDVRPTARLAAAFAELALVI